jgi:hypothetical protein
VKFEEAARLRRTTHPNSVDFGYSVLNAAKIKKILVSCTAAQPLRAEAKSVLSRLPLAIRKSSDGLEFVNDIAEFESECLLTSNTSQFPKE